MLKIGLIVNPVAGVGGKAGLKGSDGVDIQKLALEKGSFFESSQKTKIALNEIRELKNEIMFFTGSGDMGENILAELDFNYKVLGTKNLISSTGKDTEKLAKEMLELQSDIIVFAGGDGTARNIYNAVGLGMLCLGIPAGVKIHSAVYANNPKSAGITLKMFVSNLSSAIITACEVMDINEDLFRKDIVEAKLYGYLKIPYINNLMQKSKASIKCSEHDIEGIADEIIDRSEKKDKNICYVFGTGGTTFNVMKHMGLEGSLLGVDVVLNKRIILKDASEEELHNFLSNREFILIVTVIGGQGHIFGRGNQQLSPNILKSLKKENLWIIASANKIYSLKDNSLYVDTSDPCLDKELSGYKRVIVGWQEEIVCKINC